MSKMKQSLNLDTRSKMYLN